VRVAERPAPVRTHVSVQPQKRQHGKYDHDETNDIYEIIHVEFSAPRVDALAIREAKVEQSVCHVCLVRMIVGNAPTCADSYGGSRGIDALLGSPATWEDVFAVSPSDRAERARQRVAAV